MFLFVGTRCVGKAEIFKGSGNTEKRELHGHSLQDFARSDEDLVAIYHARIYTEYENEPYPFSYYDFEGPPEKLGELNDVNGKLNAIVAWDLRQTKPNIAGCNLGCNSAAEQGNNGTAGNTAGPTPVHGKGVVPNHLFVEPSDDEEDKDISGPQSFRCATQRHLPDSIQELPREDTVIREEYSGDSEVELNAQATGSAFPYSNIIESEPYAVQKRSYTFKSRERGAPPDISLLHQRRLQLSRRPDNPFTKPRDCCKKRCFDLVDPVYCFAKYRKLMISGQIERKQELIRLLNPENGKIKFEGHYVCVQFLEKGFGFSRDLQCSVKKTPSSKPASIPMRMPREIQTGTKRDAIINYIERVAKDTGDDMPHRDHVQLPSFRKKQVYNDYIEYIQNRSLQSLKVPSLNYFYAVWKEYCTKIKSHRYHGFTVCSRCEDLRSRMEENTGDVVALRALRQQRMSHLQMIAAERRGYTMRKELSSSSPTEYYSIIVDGADQTAYGLPHFVRSSKSDRGHKIKVRCVGILEHLQVNHLTLFTLTSEFETGANHVIEAIHRVVQGHKNRLRKLPPVFYIQADNCSRENKNKYFMAYVEMLVAAGVFVEVQVSFLPVGHTHTDIDQSFSSVSSYLRVQKAITMSDMLASLQECYSPRAKAFEMTEVINFSKLCEETRCLENIEGISQYRYFKFFRALGPKEGIYFPTCCHAKVQLRDEWEPIGLSNGTKSFLTTVPDLSRTPRMATIPPDDVLEVNKHLSSVEERVRDRQKMAQLMELRDRIYTSRYIPFHWNLSQCYEARGDYLNENQDERITVNVPDTFEYQHNAFVAVRPDGSDGYKFWIARILGDAGAEKLRIRWFISAQGSRDEFVARYEPANVFEGTEHIPYYETIEKQSVIVYFEKLTTTGRLFRATKTAIRSALDIN